MYGKKVRLTVDLTRYLEGLVVGTEGVTCAPVSFWAKGSDRFTGVHFPGKGSLDVLWQSLEVIDERTVEDASGA